MRLAPRLARTLLLAVIAIGALTACGRGGDDVPSLAITMFQGADAVGGEEVQLADVLDRGKPVVLNFYAGLCPPCRAEMPHFQRLHEEYADDVLMLGVDIGPYVFLGSREDAKRLLVDLDITYPAGTTYQASVISDFVIPAMPTTLFITRNGKVLDRWEGFLPESKAREYFTRLAAP